MEFRLVFDGEEESVGEISDPLTFASALKESKVVDINGEIWAVGENELYFNTWRPYFYLCLDKVGGEE